MKVVFGSGERKIESESLCQENLVTGVIKQKLKTA